MNQPGANNREHQDHHGSLIFVVDDEPMLLELTEMILASAGYRVRTFRDGKSALDAYSSSQPPPALIITDYAMHSMNGMSLIEQCRRIRPAQKTLLVSGSVTETIYDESACKPDRFLAKPYEPKQLLSAVKLVLRD
jgi:DNA-binding NtrC family response regulator